MSLSLENGHIVYQYYLGDGSYARIPTDFKYNRNKWVSVALIRNGYFGELLLLFQAEFITLSLENGHIVFQYYLGNGSYARERTEFKYNTNKWVSVGVVRRGYAGEFFSLARTLPSFQKPVADLEGVQGGLLKPSLRQTYFIFVGKFIVK